ncbi:MAG TPA: CBS domain-containing protein, partial [Candidatus Limnocylindrales bacterium]|nr:CBS domain-containing protein [Candidatus Limnocylindrales bacterium]
AIAWLLNYLHPLFDRITTFIKRHRPVTFHTGLYDREDLVELMEIQRTLPDNRMSPAELDLVMHALTFGEVLVQAVMVPRRAVVMVAATDVVGPILMSEVHKSGHSRFPVYGTTKDQVVGTLYLRDMLDAKQGGRVNDIAKKDVYYVHEDETLFQVLHAFIKTKHHLFIVVNSFEEFVGVITIEDVLEQVIGRKIEDEFDRYDDIRAVAGLHAKREHARHKAGLETEPEVVE